MGVGMIQQGPRPGVQHGQDGQLSADLLGVPSQFLQRRGIRTYIVRFAGGNESAEVIGRSPGATVLRMVELRAVPGARFRVSRG